MVLYKRLLGYKANIKNLTATKDLFADTIFRG